MCMGFRNCPKIGQYVSKFCSWSSDLSLQAFPTIIVGIFVGSSGAGNLIYAQALLDEKAYPTPVFKKLYSLRWGVEENYKREKQRIEIENFSGRSVEVICQDFHAKILALNLSAMVVWVAQAIAERYIKIVQKITKSILLMPYPY